MPQHPRPADLRYLLERIAGAQCVSLVGVSNMGKSALLRELCLTELPAEIRPDLDGNLNLFYIDCNRMLEQSEHAFYELVLRVFIADLQNDEPALTAELRQAYDTLLNPPNDFHIPLSFSRALTTQIETHQRRSVLIFDEFDGAYEGLDARVFLNLRAMKDRYGPALTYITATDRRLADIRTGELVDEFRELFGIDVHYVGPLDKENARAYISTRAQLLNASFDGNDIDFLLKQASGHPSLTDIACRRLAVITGETERSDSQDWLIHREVRDKLREDLSVSAECQKMWRDLSGAERAVLEGLFRASGVRNAQAARELVRKGLLIEREEGFAFFSALFEDYVQRQSAVQFGPEKGVRLDVESGSVSVEGRTIETLTNLEYRLLLLFYGRLNKICDKYSIVEAVWGEEYVDEIYDASIEKLVSRLRRKLEPDPSSPHYIITVRGRGYKLVG